MEPLHTNFSPAAPRLPEVHDHPMQCPPSGASAHKYIRAARRPLKETGIDLIGGCGVS